MAPWAALRQSELIAAEFRFNAINRWQSSG
jgi:hypothetical protein